MTGRHLARRSLPTLCYRAKAKATCMSVVCFFTSPSQHVSQLLTAELVQDAMFYRHANLMAPQG